MTQERIRVLIAYSTRYPVVRGGVDTMIVSLVDQLRKNHDVMLFAAGQPEETDLSCSTVDGVKTYVMHLRLLYYSKFTLRNFVAWLFDFPRALFKIMRLVRKEKIDIVHLHMLNRYNLVFVALRLLGGPPYIVTLHRAEVFGHRAQRWATRLIDRCILRHASRINAVSRWLAGQAEAIFPFVGHVVCVPNGIDVSIRPGVPRQELEVTIGGPLPQAFFTMIGTLQEYKAQDVAIRAWARLRHNLPNVHLFIVGDGELKENYRLLIESLGCHETVHLVGRLPRETALSLAGRGVGVIFPSRNEGQGFVLLEAGILKLPVICTDIGPFLEVITDSVDAIVVPVDDFEAIAAAVEDLMQNPDIVLRLGTALHRLVESEYSSELMAQKYVAIYVEALAARRPNSRRLKARG